MDRGPSDPDYRHRERLTRRVALAGLIGTIAASPVQAANNVLVVYVCAEDCSPCQVFAAVDWPQFLASPLAKRIRFFRTTAPKTTNAYQIRYWPPETRPYHGVIKVPIVPSFILVNNGAVLMIGSGLSGWRTQVLPQIRILVG